MGMIPPIRVLRVLFLKFLRLMSSANISILGSTGSIGVNTLKVVDHLGNVRVSGLAAGNNVEKLAEASAPDPIDLRRARRDLATSLTNLAAVLKSRARYDDAETLYLESIAIFRETLGERH